MMKKYIILSLYVLWLSFITSCQKNPELESSDEINQSIPENILLGADASTESIEISKSNKDWSFLGGNDWLSVSKEGKILTLNAKENTNQEARSTTIIVSSRNQSKNINIEQKGVGVMFSAEQKDINIDQWSEELFIAIDSNVDEWDVISTTSKWLDFEVNTSKKELHVMVKENFDRDERTASFFVQTKSGEGDYEITLTQKGALFHLLPYMGFGETDSEVTNFERQRRSRMVAYPGSGGSSMAGAANTNTWVFETVSKVFNRIDYIIEEDLRRYRGAMVWATDPMAFARNDGSFVDDVENFLISEGFESRAKNTFYNREYQCVAIISFTEAGSHIRYIFEPLQPAPAPTFNSYPWGIMENMNWRTLTREQVEVWEAQHGGKYLDEERDSEAEEEIVAFTSEENGGMIRYYVFSSAQENQGYPLTDVSHVFTDTSKVYFEVRGTVLPTREFRELALSAGFVWYGILGTNVYTFTHPKRKLFMGAYQLLELDPDDENQILRFAKIDYLHDPSGGQNGMSGMTKKVSFEDAAIKKITRKYINAKKSNNK